MKFRQDKRIERKFGILGGKPVIKGTRIAVDFILELLAQGWTTEQILKNYPQIKRDDIIAVLEYSARALKKGNNYIGGLLKIEDGKKYRTDCYLWSNYNDNTLVNLGYCCSN